MLNKITLAIVLCFVTPAFATSIPVNASLTEDGIKSAVKVCYQSLLKKIFVQIFPASASNTLSYQTDFYWHDFKNPQAERAWQPYTYLSMKTPGLFGGTATPMGGDGRSNQVNFNSNGASIWNMQVGDVHLAIQGKLPTVYSTPAYESSYNGWGNVAETRRLVRNVRIEGDLGQLYFVNVYTRQPVGITADTAEYARCLQSELR